MRLASLLLLASVSSLAAEPAPARSPYTVTPIPLAGSGPASLDYIAFDPATSTLWVPAGNRGQIDVLDTKQRAMATVDGIPTAERTSKERGKYTVGPTSATIGKAAVYIGNRADSKVCAVDPKTRKLGACVELKSMPDGLAYVAPTEEVWATTPHDHSLTVISTSGGALTVTSTLPMDGEPEGYAVDEKRGVFYTNLEDKDRTLAIDAKSHKITATFNPECGEKGPRGLVLDPARHWLYVACWNGARVLDLAHGGKVLGRIETGAGVDNIDYAPKTHQLFIASGKAGNLTVAAVDAKGALSKHAEVPTAEGCRAVVVDEQGTAYVADPKGGRVLVVEAAK